MGYSRPGPTRKSEMRMRCARNKTIVRRGGGLEVAAEIWSQGDHLRDTS